MIDRWNSVVKPDDIVFHLGDFGIHRNFLHAIQLGDLKTVFTTLNGRKILIIGNHDKQPVLDLPWEKQIYSTSIKVNGQDIWLKHFPPKGKWPGKDKGAWCLYGHVHGRRQPKPRCFDVGGGLLGLSSRCVCRNQRKDGFTMLG